MAQDSRNTGGFGALLRSLFSRLLSNPRLRERAEAFVLEHGAEVIENLAEQALHGVFGHNEDQQAQAPAATPAAPVSTAPVSVAPDPGPVSTQIIDEIVFDGIFFEGDRQGGSAGQIITDPAHVQLKNERAKLGFTAFFRGVKVADEVVRTLYLVDGHSPVAQPVYGYLRADGSEEVHTNSQDHPDAFELQGYDKRSGPNAGFTYVLFLEGQRGPGQGTAFGRLELPGVGKDGRVYNGGVTVRSRNRATWQTD